MFRGVESQTGSFLEVCFALTLAIHQAPKRLFAVMPRRGSSVIDEVDSLLRDGKQRAPIFTPRFHEIGPLSDKDAALAISNPIREEGESITSDAVAEIVRITQGYPYFLQD